MNFEALLHRGGPIMFILFAISIVVVALVLAKLLEFRRLEVWKQRGLDGLPDRVLQEDTQALVGELSLHPSPVAKVAVAVLSSAAEEAPRSVVKEIERVASHELQRMERGLRAISIIAHLSPLIGLLGTVTGMISAFHALEAAGMRSNPALLAGGIWEALLTTAYGLSIAIPSIAAFHYLEGLVDGTSHRMKDLSERLLQALERRRVLEEGKSEKRRAALRA